MNPLDNPPDDPMRSSEPDILELQVEKLQAEIADLKRPRLFRHLPVLIALVTSVGAATALYISKDYFRDLRNGNELQQEEIRRLNAEMREDSVRYDHERIALNQDIRAFDGYKKTVAQEHLKELATIRAAGAKQIAAVRDSVQHQVKLARRDAARGAAERGDAFVRSEGYPENPALAALIEALRKADDARGTANSQLRQDRARRLASAEAYYLMYALREAMHARRLRIDDFNRFVEQVRRSVLAGAAGLAKDGEALASLHCRQNQWPAGDETTACPDGSDGQGAGPDRARSAPDDQAQAGSPVVVICRLMSGCRKATGESGRATKARTSTKARTTTKARKPTRARTSTKARKATKAPTRPSM